MIKRLFKSGIAVIVAFSMIIMPETLAKAETTVNYEDVVKQADTQSDQLTSVYGETSVQYALIDNGKIVVSGQSGVYSKEQPNALTGSSMYGIGSVSKMYTTVAVMQLAEQGRINLDTPVVKYIPEFKMADPRYKDITVRMLLNHSSGLMGTTSSDMMLFGDNDTIGYNKLLSTLQTQRLKAAPGEFSVYCNDGFTLAQLLVEKVSGESFTEYMKKNISDPLGLLNTKTPLDTFSRGQLAKTYLIVDKALPTDNVSTIGAGGIYSTAEDLCHFAESFMDSSSSKVLSADSAKATAEPVYLRGLWSTEGDSCISYGLGWDSVDTYPFTQYGIKALVKGGDTLLYHASLIVLPEKNMAVAVLSSGGSSGLNQIFAQNILLKALLAKGTINEIKADKTFTTPVRAPMPSEYKDYAGYYGYCSGVLKADISDDGLLVLYQNGNTSPLTAEKYIYTGDGKFYNTTGNGYKTFKKEKNGETYLYTVSYDSVPKLGQIALSTYQAQKLAANPLSKKVKAAWEKRNNKKYFLLNEKYSSQAYLSAPVALVGFLDGLEGYCGPLAITDSNTAKSRLEIPGMYGRDLSDISFYTKKKTEYALVAGNPYISEDALKALPSKATFKVAIGSNGYAQWYKVSTKLGDKKIKVTLPKKASCSVYSKDGTLVYNSFISDDSAVTLPDGGYIVFAGKAGAEFTVNYAK